MSDEDERQDIVCSNPDCRVAETDRCVEGLEFDACPYYGRKAGESSEISIPEEEDEGESISLPSGNTLSPTEASGILRQGPARVIAVIGPINSGKTSLIASLYDQFQEGGIEQVEFSCSQTLQAFEHTCHDARAMSRRGTPHTNRTPLGEVSFYHLEVIGGPAGEKVALLLGDRSGEEYEAVADDVSVVASFCEVSRSDSLTILVDGERLLGGERHNLHSNIIMMLQALRDGCGLPKDARLALVLTKLDAVNGVPESTIALRAFQRLFEDVQRLFSDVLKTIESFHVAASPKSNALPRGTGVGALLSFWIETPISPVSVKLQRPNYARAFARLRPLEEPAEVARG